MIKDEFLYTLFQNLHSTQERVRILKGKASEPYASCGSSLEIREMLMGGKFDPKVVKNIEDTVDAIGSRGDAHQMQLRHTQLDCEQNAAAKLEVLIDTYLNLAYKKL